MEEDVLEARSLDTERTDRARGGEPVELAERVAGHDPNLAAAVVHDPEVVLLDEPTVGVDPQSRNLVLENVLALRDRGRAIVYTTHYMEEAERLCDRVAIVDHGRLLALGTVAELLAAHGGTGALVASTPAGDVRVVTGDPLGELNRLAASGPVRSFRVERARLEDVFLHLTGRRLRD